MKKILIGAMALGGVALFAYWLVLTLASDETRIRWLIEDMESGFNDGSVSSLAAGIAEDFSHDSGATRNIVLLAFMQFVRRNLDNDRNFRHRCEVASIDEISVTANSDPPSGSATVTVRFFRRPSKPSVDDPGKYVGTVTFEADLVVEGGDWKIIRTLHRTIDGRRPY